MRALIQRCSRAQVTVDGIITGQISKGLLILLGVGHFDSEADIDYLIRKITSLRIWSDIEGKMNSSTEDIEGEYLIVSQFTLLASTKKGNRPSYTKAAKPQIAEKLYGTFIHNLREKSGSERVKTGKFGSDMKVELTNDGPVTIWMDSKEKL